MQTHPSADRRRESDAPAERRPAPAAAAGDSDDGACRAARLRERLLHQARELAALTGDEVLIAVASASVGSSEGGRAHSPRRPPRRHCMHVYATRAWAPLAADRRLAALLRDARRAVRIPVGFEVNATEERRRLREMSAPWVQVRDIADGYIVAGDDPRDAYVQDPFASALTGGVPTLPPRLAEMHARLFATPVHARLLGGTRRRRRQQPGRWRRRPHHRFVRGEAPLSRLPPLPRDEHPDRDSTTRMHP